MDVKPPYKQTEVGLIPQDWNVRELRQIGKFSKGRGLLKEDIQTSGAVPAIPYTALYTDFSEVVDYGAIKWFVDDIRGTIVVSEPCVLIASSSNMAANTGKASALAGTQPVAIGREVIIFTTVESAIFLSYILSTAPYRKRTLVLARGTTIKHLYPATFADYKVAVPPPAEQRAITAALRDTDALLAGLDRLIAKKRDLKQAAMQQLLTGQTRLPGFQGKWEVKRLGDMAQLNRQNVVPASQPNQPFVHFSLPAFDAGAGAQVELGATIGSNKFGVPRNAVLVSKLNPRIPRVWAPEAVPANACASTEWLVLTPREGIERKFLFVVCCSSEFSGQMALAATGTTGSHQRISPRTALDIRLRVPVEQVEQIAIAAVLSDMDAELTALEARREKTRALKQGMMQELLTGRTRLI